MKKIIIFSLALLTSQSVSPSDDSLLPTDFPSSSSSSTYQSIDQAPRDIVLSSVPTDESSISIQGIAPAPPDSNICEEFIHLSCAPCACVYETTRLCCGCTSMYDEHGNRNRRKRQAVGTGICIYFIISAVFTGLSQQ